MGVIKTFIPNHSVLKLELFESLKHKESILKNAIVITFVNGDEEIIPHDTFNKAERAYDRIVSNTTLEGIKLNR